MFLLNNYTDRIPYQYLIVLFNKLHDSVEWISFNSVQVWSI